MNQTGASASASASTCLRRAMFLVAVATIALALLGLTVPPAFGHTHPTPVERTEPAVVRVETSVQVDISLMEHDRHGKHIGLYQRRYETVVNAGSGFAVDPSGVIVAAGGVIKADTRVAEIYAVNRIFNDRYANQAPLPADPTTKTTIRDEDPDDPVNGRLQRCYRANTADTTGGCVIATSRVIRVYPYVSSQARYGNLAASVYSAPAVRVVGADRPGRGAQREHPVLHRILPRPGQGRIRCRLFAVLAHRTDPKASR